MTDSALYKALLELADDHLVIGHRLSEWCGHAPSLEEELALPNIALDLIGVARRLYERAAELAGGNATEDSLAYLRSEREFVNCLLVEQPNTDFAYTIFRQFYFSSFMKVFWQRVVRSPGSPLRSVAAMAVNEASYHLRYAGEWVVRLGDGTEESSRRAVAASSYLFPYVEELFVSSPCARECEGRDFLPARADLRGEWTSTLVSVFRQATIPVPKTGHVLLGGRKGLHGEGLGRMLAEMQHLQRAYPGASW